MRLGNQRDSCVLIVQRAIFGVTIFLICGEVALAKGPGGITSIFDPHSTPARTIHDTSLLVLWISLGIFLVVAGLLTFYFVTTGLLAVRRRAQESLWMDRVAVLFVVTVSVLAFTSGLELLRRGRPETMPSFIFGIVGMLAAAGDIRMMRARGSQGPFDPAQGGPHRIARHLWRMCFAMWVAAASFFWGPPRRVPEVIRIPALQAVAVLLPIAVMLYWLWRLRGRRTLQGIVNLSAPRADALEQF